MALKLLARVAGRVAEVSVDLGSAPPLVVASSQTYTVAAGTQVLVRVPIRTDGLLVIDGLLVEV